ncbi:MAG: hypothetical protein GFH27_549327n82 [Chloroflexi bacterium AL-W]|nr:hypothetical protein [Chloroflexi bacterium AL-W]
MARKLLPICITALALVFTAACGSSEQTAQNVQEDLDTPTTSEAVDPTSPPEPEPTDVPIAETRDLSDVEGNLAELESYRLQLNISFEGTNDDGEPESGTIEMTQAFIAVSNDQHMQMVMDGTDIDGTEGTFEFFQVDGTTYIYSVEAGSEAQCFSFSSDEEALDTTAMLQPADFMGGIEEAKLVGKSEVINGINTDHYAFDQAGLSFGLFASAQGEAWIAQDGGYMVKYLGEASGTNALFGASDVEGTIIWEYNLEDINTVDSIVLPPECAAQSPADDVPVPDNAVDKANFAGLITFSSPDTPTDVAAYYRDEMPAQGWGIGEETTFGDFITLEFTKEERTLSITISPDEESGGSDVMLNELAET